MTNLLDHLPPVNRLRFPPDFERLFQEDYWRRYAFTMRIAIAVGLVMYGAFGILDAWAMPTSLRFVWLMRFGVGCPVIAVVLIISFFQRLRGVMQAATGLVGLVAGMSIVAMIGVSQPDEIGYAFYYVGLLLVLMYVYSFFRLQFWYAITASAVITGAYEFVAINHQQMLASREGLQMFISNNFFFLAADIVGVFTCYSLELYSRRDFLQRRAIETERTKAEQEKKRADDLLDAALTRPVAEELRRTGEFSSRMKEVCVIAVDVVGFSTLCETLPVNLIVDEINRFYKVFDECCMKYGVEPLRSQGDSRLAIAGIWQDHRKAVSRPAIDAILTMLEFRSHLAPLKPDANLAACGERLSFNARIGIHIGPVVMGIIQGARLCFDILGETVNVAARLEQAAEANQILASERVLWSLRGLFHHGDVRETKSKQTLIKCAPVLDIKESYCDSGGSPNNSFWEVYRRSEHPIAPPKATHAI